MLRWADKNIAIPENAVKAKHILILKIAAAAPLKHLYPNGIYAPLNIIGYIKFRLQVAALCKSDLAPVYV